MLIINADGEYEYEENTLTPKKSDHPVYKARIEIALGQGAWMFAPSAGHQLAKYERAHQTEGNTEKFEKELALYLKKYGPAVGSLFVQRGAVSIDLKIADGVLNA